jgi:hypothetical protein
MEHVRPPAVVRPREVAARHALHTLFKGRPVEIDEQPQELLVELQAEVFPEIWVGLFCSERNRFNPDCEKPGGF